MNSGDKYLWTKHSLYKMRHYGLSPQRIKRVIRHPARIEEAIVPGMIAVMQSDKKQEIWAMYKIINSKFLPSGDLPKGDKNLRPRWISLGPKNSKLRIITAWRYPGKSPARNPIPQEVLDEIKSIV